MVHFCHPLWLDNRSPELYYPHPKRRPTQQRSQLLWSVSSVSQLPLNSLSTCADPVVVELLVDTLLAFAFAPFVYAPSYSRCHSSLSHSTNRFNRLDRLLIFSISKAVLEVIALGILWLLWLIGCGIATVRRPFSHLSPHLIASTY